MDHARVLISDKHKFIFWGVPKCATKTMNNYFMYEKKEDYGVRRVPFSTAPKKNNYFNWTFVRNPYSRVVSAFVQRIQNTHPDVVKYHKKFGLSPDTTFEEFVEHLWVTKSNAMDAHWCPMNYMLPKLEFFGKLEEFDRDFDSVRNRMGLTIYPNKVINATNKDPQDYFDEETRVMIFQRYMEDFERFNYVGNE